MGDLYEVVNKVINASSTEEADDILYGVGGININSDEYYQHIISEFIRKKEIVIEKEGNNLIFDLDYIDDLWSCTFISEYIKKELNNIEKDIMQQENITSEEKNIQIKKLNACRNGFFKLSKKLNVEFSKNVELKKEELDEIKSDIKAFHILRNSIEHGASNKASNKIEIDNFGTKIEIPIDYLDGFNKGRIIAKEEDKVTVEKTNEVLSPLLEYLNYDIRELSSFFYNVEPGYLNLLLEQVDYNLEKLYELNTNLFMYSKNTEAFIKNGINISAINKLPKYAFRYPKATLEYAYSGIDATKLPEAAFWNPKVTIKMKNKGIDITKLPDDAFWEPEITIKLHDSGIDVAKLPNHAFWDPEIKAKFQENGIDITKLPSSAFLDRKIMIKLDEMEMPAEAFGGTDIIEMLQTKGRDINVIKSSEKTLTRVEKIIELHNRGIDVTKWPLEAFDMLENVIELYDNGIDITQLNNFAFNGEATDNVYESPTKGIPPYILLHPKATIMFRNNRIDFTKLPEAAFWMPGNVIKLNRKGIDVTKLPEKAYYEPKNVIKLHNMGIDVTKLPNDAFDKPDYVIKLLNSGVDINEIEHSHTLISPLLFDVLNNKGIDADRIPIKLFHRLSMHMNYNCEINEFPKYNQEGYFEYETSMPGSNNYASIQEPLAYINKYVENVPHMLELINNGVKRTQTIIINKYADNISHLLELTNNNYEELEKFPIEFFTYKKELVDEMYKTYNSNIAKSIFGINNSKLIATLVYCNSVFKNYQKERNDSSLIDSDITSMFITSSLKDTINYSNNIESKDFNEEKYVNQFELDENGNERDEESKKAYLLDKLRNSMAHFRFRPVKDKDGNLVQDKIYLYDKYDELADHNFDIVIDINELVGITHEVEKGLNKGITMDTEKEFPTGMSK